MARTKRLLTTTLAVAAAGLFLFSSHWAGGRIARAGLLPTAPRGASRSSAKDAPPARPRPGQSGPGDVVAGTKKRLAALVAASAELQMDWETRSTIRKALAGLSAEELAAFHATLHLPEDRYLAMACAAAWAELDPAAAFQAALSDAKFIAGLSDTENEPLDHARWVFKEWAGSDPAAALAWLGSEENLPPEVRDMQDWLYFSVINGLVEKDFDLATRSVLKMDPEKGGRQLQLWGQAYSGDPAMRDQLVAFARDSGRPQDYAALNAGLLETWPQDDSVGMMHYLTGLKDYLESGRVPVEARPAVDAAAVGAAMGREYDRPGLEWWMERYSGSREIPNPLAAALYDWQGKHPEKVAQWLAEQPASLQLDAIRSNLATAQAMHADYQGAAARVTQISDPALRQQAAEGVNRYWSNLDPEAAAAWRATLPENFPATPK